MERNILVMSMSAVFLNVAMALYGGSFTSLYFQSLGVDMALLGGIFSVFAMTRGLIQLPGGHYADVYGRKTLIVLGGTLYAASLFPIFWVTTNIWYIAVICLILAQLGIMLYQPGAQAMISESVSARSRATGFATFYFIIGLGSLVAPVFAGYLSVGGNYGILFLIASLILFCVVISRLVFLSETKVKGKSLPEMGQSADRRLSFIEKMRLTWNSGTSTRAYIIFTLASSISFSIAGPYFAIFYGNVIGMDQPQIGWASFAFGLSLAIMQIPGGKLSDRIGRRPLILLGLIVGPITTLAMTQATSFLQIVFIEVISGAMVGLQSASAMTLPTELVSTEYRATALGVFRATGQIANAIGSALGGLICSFYSFNVYPRYVFYASILASVPSTILFLLLVKETLKKEKTTKFSST